MSARREPPPRARPARWATALAFFVCVPLFGVPSGLPAPFCYLACVWFPAAGFASARVWGLAAQARLAPGAAAALGASVGTLVGLVAFTLHLVLEDLTLTRIVQHTDQLPPAALDYVQFAGGTNYVILLTLLALATAALGALLGAVGGALGALAGKIPSKR